MIAVRCRGRYQLACVRRQRTAALSATVQKPAAFFVVDLRAGKPTDCSRHVHQLQLRLKVRRNHANVRVQPVLFSVSWRYRLHQQCLHCLHCFAIFISTISLKIKTQQIYLKRFRRMLAFPRFRPILGQAMRALRWAECNTA